MGLRFGGRPGQCPVTEDAADRLVRLPFFTSMTEAEQGDVIAALESFSGG
jgi:dTDP-4-amino-4,6-dideoxygalactose transaminase